jgi:hypothetical protein
VFVSLPNMRNKMCHVALYCKKVAYKLADLVAVAISSYNNQVNYFVCKVIWAATKKVLSHCHLSRPFALLP